MPGSRSTPPPGATPPAGSRAALDALLADSAGDILRRARWLDAVDQLLRPHLPPMLAAHARLTNIRGGKLVFVVDAPVWHARLRLATPALLDAARSVGLDVADVAVRTTHEPLHPLLRLEKPRTPMSAAAQSELEAALALLRSDASDPGKHRRGEGDR